MYKFTKKKKLKLKLNFHNFVHIVGKKIDNFSMKYKQGLKKVKRKNVY